MFQPPLSPTDLLQIMLNIEVNSKITSQQELDIKQLLGKGIDSCIKTEGNGNSVLMLAILYGSESFVIEVINRIKDVAALNQPDHNEDALNSPLLLSIKRGMYDAAILLVERGVELNYVSRKGFTALHYACGMVGMENKNNDYSKDMKIIRLIHNMLNKGADPRKLTCFNSTPLDLLKRLPTLLDFLLVQETQPYRIARLLNIELDLAKSWCDLNNRCDTKALQDVKFNRINHLYSKYQEFNIKVKDIKSETEVTKINKEYQDALDAFDEFASKKIYSVGMIIKLNLHGAHKSNHIHDLIEKGIFEQIRKIVKELDVDDFSTIVDNLIWHRGESRDLLKAHITQGRFKFYQNHPDEITKLEEHILESLNKLNLIGSAHDVKQMP